MTLTETENAALATIEGLTGTLSADQRTQARAAIRDAMTAAMSACCVENARAVSEVLRHDPTLFHRINEDADTRRKALIANLSAQR